jgi:hypothetical protein
LEEDEEEEEEVETEDDEDMMESDKLTSDCAFLFLCLFLSLLSVSTVY